MKVKGAQIKRYLTPDAIKKKNERADEMIEDGIKKKVNSTRLKRLKAKPWKIKQSARVVLAAWAQYVKDLVLQQVSKENKSPGNPHKEHLVHPETKGFTAWADSEFVSNCEAADAQTVISLY